MKYRTLRQIVDQLEGCGFCCEAGPLENNVAFEELRDLADRLGGIHLIELAPSALPKRKSTAPIPRAKIRAKAAEALAKWPDDPKVRREVDALLNSVGDTLSNRVIYAELKSIAESKTSFVEVVARVKASRKRRPAPRRK